MSPWSLLRCRCPRQTAEPPDRLALRERSRLRLTRPPRCPRPLLHSTLHSVRYLRVKDGQSDVRVVAVRTQRRSRDRDGAELHFVPRLLASCAGRRAPALMELVQPSQSDSHRLRNRRSNVSSISLTATVSDAASPPSLPPRVPLRHRAAATPAVAEGDRGRTNNPHALIDSHTAALAAEGERARAGKSQARRGRRTHLIRANVRPAARRAVGGTRSPPRAPPAASYEPVALPVRGYVSY